MAKKKNDPTNWSPLPYKNTSCLQFLRSHKCNLLHKQKKFLCLLDLGATVCWISHSKLPPYIRTYHVAPVRNQTLAGNFTANEEIKLHNILLPEFHKTRRIQTLTSKIFDNRCRYDMSLGRNLMNDLGIVIDFNNKSMVWDGSTVSMRGYDQNHEPTTLATNLLLDILDSHLEANDSILMLDKPSDMNYQKRTWTCQDTKPKRSIHLYTNLPIYRILWINVFICYRSSENSFTLYSINSTINLTGTSKPSRAHRSILN